MGISAKYGELCFEEYVEEAQTPLCRYDHELYSATPYRGVTHVIRTNDSVENHTLCDAPGDVQSKRRNYSWLDSNCDYLSGINLSPFPRVSGCGVAQMRPRKGL